MSTFNISAYGPRVCVTAFASVFFHCFNEPPETCNISATFESYHHVLDNIVTAVAVLSLADLTDPLFLHQIKNCRLLLFLRFSRCSNALSLSHCELQLLLALRVISPPCCTHNRSCYCPRSFVFCNSPLWYKFSPTTVMSLVLQVVQAFPLSHLRADNSPTNTYSSPRSIRSPREEKTVQYPLTPVDPISPPTRALTFDSFLLLMPTSTLTCEPHKR